MPRHFYYSHFAFLAPAPTSGGFQDLPEAMESYVLSQPTLVAATSDGKLWHEEAPQGTKLPYATFVVASESIEDRSTGPAYEKVRALVDLSFHHWTVKKARDLARTFKASLRMAPLIINGDPVLHCVLAGEASAVGEGKGDSGRDCRIQIVTFDVLYTRSY